MVTALQTTLWTLRNGKYKKGRRETAGQLRGGGQDSANRGDYCIGDMREMCWSLLILITEGKAGRKSRDILRRDVVKHLTISSSHFAPPPLLNLFFFSAAPAKSWLLTPHAALLLVVVVVVGGSKEPINVSSRCRRRGGGAAFRKPTVPSGHWAKTEQQKQADSAGGRKRQGGWQHVSFAASNWEL